MASEEHCEQRPARLSNRPKELKVEVVRKCNLRCPVCPVGMGVAKVFPSMPFEMYKNIIDVSASGASKLFLHNYGDPLLHPHIAEFVRYAKNAGIESVKFDTNGCLLDAKMAAELIDARLDEICISLDGVDQASYEAYRVGGDFKLVVNNIAGLVQLKRSLSVAKPAVVVQFIVMKHNERYITSFLELCERLGVDSAEFKTYNAHMDLETGSRGTERIPKDLRLSRYTNRDGKLSHKDEKRKKCRWPYKSMVVNADGTIVPCSYDYNNLSPLGDFRNYSGGVWWETEARLNFIKMMTTNPDGLDLCRNCQWGIRTLDYQKVVKISRSKRPAILRVLRVFRGLRGRVFSVKQGTDKKRPVT